MVLCAVIGCSKRSGRDKDVSFYRIPKVIAHRGKQEYELTKKRRAGFLAAISRDTKGTHVLENDRICSRHFISGKPAYLYDETNPDWLPTLYLGHSKKQSNKQGVERWARKQAREQSVKEAESEAAEALLTLGDTPTVEPLETGVTTQTELTSTNVQDMQDELDRSREIIDDLTLRLTQHVAPYTEESLTSDQIVKFYTALPNKRF